MIVAALAHSLKPLKPTLLLYRVVSLHDWQTTFISNENLWEMGNLIAFLHWTVNTYKETLKMRPLTVNMWESNYNQVWAGRGISFRRPGKHFLSAGRLQMKFHIHCYFTGHGLSKKKAQFFPLSAPSDAYGPICLVQCLILLLSVTCPAFLSVVAAGRCEVNIQ